MTFDTLTTLKQAQPIQDKGQDGTKDEDNRGECNDDFHDDGELNVSNSTVKGSITIQKSWIPHPPWKAELASIPSF